MKILLTYKLANSVDRLNEFCQNLGTTHELHFVVYDCRLNKENFTLGGAHVIPVDFEESFNLNQKTILLAQEYQTNWIISIEESVEFTQPRTLDLLFDEDSINDVNVGGVYSDFLINYDGLKVPQFHSSLPSRISAFPLVAFKTDLAQKFPELNITQLQTSCILKHVPQLLALVNA